MLARVRAGLQAANSQRQRGSSLAAYQVLRDDGREHGARRRGAALRRRLAHAARGRSRAPPRRATALDASLELDRGLDDVLSLASDGRLPRDVAPPKLLPVGEAALYADGCPDLFALAQRLDGPREGVGARVAAVLDDLRAHPRCAQVRRVLERAAPDSARARRRLDQPRRARGGRRRRRASPAAAPSSPS